MDRTARLEPLITTANRGPSFRPIVCPFEIQRSIPDSTLQLDTARIRVPASRILNATQSLAEEPPSKSPKKVAELVCIAAQGRGTHVRIAVDPSTVSLAIWRGRRGAPVALGAAGVRSEREERAAKRKSHVV